MKKVLVTAGITLAVVVIILAGLVLVFSRPFTNDAPVFAASRFTSGNHVFPTQVAVYPTKVIRYTPKWIGHEEQTISVDQIASVRIDAGMLFADVVIETTGGSQPIVCHGHWKGDAEGIRERISEAQAARPVGLPR
jgi:hypothetical protein